jgi:RNA polymerase sigma factor (sigma-70 family)
MTTLRMTDERVVPAPAAARESASASTDGTAAPRDVGQIVREHADWVYSAALRMVGGRADLAADVTQAVFLLLWQRPEKTQGKSISGWLFQVTRYCAFAALRAERRRARHEKRAATMVSEAASATQRDEAAWEQLAPVLDELVAGLRARERELVLCRFYQGKTMAQIGHLLGISEDAARKRVAYVVEKLRKKLRRKGVTMASELAAGTMLAHVTHISPPAVKAAAAAAMSANATASTAQVLALAKGATTTMMITKLKTIAAVMALATSIGTAAALAAPLIVAQVRGVSPVAAAVPVVGRAPVLGPKPAIATDEALAPLLNARTNMVQVIDPLAIDWNAVDAARDQFLARDASKAGNATTPADPPARVPTFAHSMTAVYRRWTGEFRNAGGARICLVSQVGVERENPGAFTVFSTQDGADPAKLIDVCTPSSYTAQQHYEARVVGKVVVAANHRMVTALQTAKAESRPDIMEALAASRMPIRIVWSPQQCRQGGRPSVSNTAIDFGTDSAFSGPEWDKVIWMTKGYTPPPARASELIIKCQDDAAARAMRDWIAEQVPKHKRVPPATGTNFGAVTQMTAVKDQVRIVTDPTPTERLWLLGNTFNVAP